MAETDDEKAARKFMDELQIAKSLPPFGELYDPSGYYWTRVWWDPESGEIRSERVYPHEARPRPTGGQG